MDDSSSDATPESSSESLEVLYHGKTASLTPTRARLPREAKKDIGVLTKACLEPSVRKLKVLMQAIDGNQTPKKRGAAAPMTSPSKQNVVSFTAKYEVHQPIFCSRYHLPSSKSSRTTTRQMNRTAPNGWCATPAGRSRELRPSRNVDLRLPALVDVCRAVPASHLLLRVSRTLLRRRQRRCSAKS